MRLCILDLDESLALQAEIIARYRPAIITAREWGPSIRLACSFARFRRFEQKLADWLPNTNDTQPSVTLYGSGDFHHVSLALLRRLRTPINLLVLDNHPDWMRGVPFLHCGTWLYHAARLAMVKRIFHVGGDVDFDNHYQGMAPWKLLRSGKIVVFPGTRRFERGAWSNIANEPLRPRQGTPVGRDRAHELLQPFRRELASYPLYISLDKDVIREEEAVVNWDSGQLTLAEVCTLLRAFISTAQERLAGMDITGDWSPVHVEGMLRHFMHWTEHPALTVDAQDAAVRNAQTNLALLDAVHTVLPAEVCKS
jgi:hypothetical protein